MHNKQPIPEGAYVLHSTECTSRACCSKQHLRLGDAAANAADKVAMGRSNAGRSITINRFTQEQKEQILAGTVMGMSLYRLAADMNRAVPSIRNVVKKNQAEIARRLRAKAEELTNACIELSDGIKTVLGEAA